MSKIGIVKDPIYTEHKTGPYHPESPERLTAIYDMLGDFETAGMFEYIHPRKARREEIELIHEPSYFDRAAATAGLPCSFLDPDTQTSEKSFEAALYAAGGILLGIDKIMEGEYRNVFALVRPPGHHAESNRGMGFCIFNNIAVGAMYALQKYSIDRILIVDWDLHHGNGTQRSFYTDNRVLYFSTHQFPYYPGTGNFDEVGRGKGAGFTINIPLSVGNGDAEYYKIFKKMLEPVAQLYKPQMVLVSAGFDIYHNDPLGGMEVTPRGIAVLSQIIQSISEEFSDGKLLMTLEGGYHIEGQTDCIRMVIKQLASATDNEKALPENGEDETGHRADPVIQKAISIQKKYWACFS